MEKRREKGGGALRLLSGGAGPVRAIRESEKKSRGGRGRGGSSLRAVKRCRDVRGRVSRERGGGAWRRGEQGRVLGGRRM